MPIINKPVSVSEGMTIRECVCVCVYQLFLVQVILWPQVPSLPLSLSPLFWCSHYNKRKRALLVMTRLMEK